MRVAIQGIAGSFHHQAALQLLGPDIELVCCDNFADVFKALEAKQAERGIVAIENSLYGSINPTYRLIANSEAYVIGELYLHINQYLIGDKKYQLASLNAAETKVMSQAPALAQAEIWLDHHLHKTTRIEAGDTAQAVQYVASKKSKNYLAVAGEAAAKEYGAKIIAGPINDNPHNYTRFFLLSPKPIKVKPADKTSIMLTVGHQPGSLYQALGIFADQEINLTKLASQPIPGDKWHYAFYIDFQSTDDQILSTLRDIGCQVTVLGQYKADRSRI